jgi:hypothetical protein
VAGPAAIWSGNLAQQRQEYRLFGSVQRSERRFGDAPRACHRLRRHLGTKADSVIAATRNDNKQNAAAQRSFAETVTDRWIDLIHA